MATAFEFPIAAKTVTVNAAFFQEIKEVSDELWQLLAQVRHVCRRAIATTEVGWQLVEMLSELRDQLALHFALEEAYGYFDDPVYVEPHVCQRADDLRHEHRELFQSLCDIVDRAEDLMYDGKLDLLSSRIPVRLETFSDQLQAHEQRENNLIFEAMNDDIGVGD